MKCSKQQWQSIGAVAMMVLLNGLVVMQLTGVSYASFNWIYFAQAYSPGSISGIVTDKTTGNPVANVIVSATAATWQTNGFGSAMTDANGKYTISDLPSGQYKINFRDSSGTYLYQYYMNVGSWDKATVVAVTIGQTTNGVNAQLITSAQAVPPQAEVSGGASTSSDPYTGQVSVFAWGDLTITRTATCTTGTPTNVILKIGSKSFSMTDAGGGQYTVTIPRAQYSQVSSESAISVEVTCSGGTETTEIGTLYIDPSGYVYDAQTQKPIVGATVTLYKDSNRTPKDTGSVDLTTQCPTINTRPNSDWFSGDLPSATVETNQVADINSGQFIPTINPLTTGTDGYYRWDVVAGCWYVEVKADRYETKVSPVVGVVEGAEVTDLDFYLERNSFGIYLPLVIK